MTVRWTQYVVDGWLRVPYSDFGDAIEHLYTVRDSKGNVFYMYQHDEETGELRLPRTALDKIGPVNTLFDARTKGRLFPDYKSEFKAREHQEEAIRGIGNYIRQRSGGVLVAGCGLGKTTMASELILRARRSTCVLVHKDFLADQWEYNLKMLSPDITVGRLKRDRCDTGNGYDVVIASTQSVTNPRREYPEDFYRSFGFLVCDEVHRYGAEVWSRAITKFPAQYRLGLTATPVRGDGLMSVVTSHIGEVGHRIEVETIKNKVFMVRIGTEVDDNLWNRDWYDDNAKKARLVTILSEHPGRNRVIAKNIRKAYFSGRVCLVISERRKQLEILRQMLLGLKVPEEVMGFFVGGTSKKNLAERDRAVELPVIFTTYQMCKEGLDIEELDCLFMATPQYSITQTVGRILRQVEGKSVPISVDFVDSNIERLRGQAFARVKQYRKMNCIVKGKI